MSWLRFSSIMALIFLWSCGREHPQTVPSFLAGHYENSNERAMRPYQGQQALVPEFQPVNTIALSWNLVSQYSMTDLLQKLSLAGINNFFIVAPIGYRDDPRWATFQSLTKAMDQIGVSLQVIESAESTNLETLNPWIRDWGPAIAKTVNGRSYRLVDFNDPMQNPFTDNTPQILSKKMGMDRVNIPVYHEGKAIANNSIGDCFISNSTVELNSQKLRPDDLRLTGNQVAENFQLWGGCTKVFFLEYLPGNRSGNLSHWMKFLTDDVVMIAEIDNSLLELYREDSGLFTEAKSVKATLDHLSEQMGNFGYYVRRVPMALPLWDHDQSVFRSFTSGIIINRTVILPHYQSPASIMTGTYFQEKVAGSWVGIYPDQDMMKQMESKAVQAYGALGLNATFVNSDQFLEVDHTLRDMILPLGYQ